MTFGSRHKIKTNNMFYKIFRKKLNIVFTPTSKAKLTFVERKSFNQDLMKAINTVGMQIILSQKQVRQQQRIQ